MGTTETMVLILITSFIYIAGWNHRDISYTRKIKRVVKAGNYLYFDNPLEIIEVSDKLKGIILKRKQLLAKQCNELNIPFRELEHGLAIDISKIPQGAIVMLHEPLQSVYTGIKSVKVDIKALGVDFYEYPVWL